ncbi:MAG: alpha/beta hydrolase [Methylococcaceae bacterium]|nr:alpha/beta hydrolase [Methylococcaceae bacterium]
MPIELQAIEVLPKGQQQYSVIWMHGLGADGHDFEAIVPELDLPDDHGIGFIFPNAPVQAVTINGGMEMRSWYDILEMSLQRRVDIEGIYHSSDLIEQLIEKEINKGIAAGNILLAGFSQGGVIALHTALRFSQRLAGVLALSCYLPTIGQLKAEKSEENQSIPIFMAHGTMDTVVDIQVAKQVFHGLEELKYPISWQEYPMQHGVCMEEIQDISQFIKAIFFK